jgi:membrane-associated protease RseP (regulator of RpoE activity)
MKDGDEIIKIDGTKVADRSDVSRLLRAGGPKKVVTVIRNGMEIDLNLSWEVPAEPKRNP